LPLMIRPGMSTHSSDLEAFVPLTAIPAHR